MSRMFQSLNQHWPEYLIEAASLAFFMISVSVYVTLLEYPESPLHRAISDPLVRRFLVGMAMGLTVVLVIYSPWGRRSGAHINPSVTLTFIRLGKVEFWDGCFYIFAQFIGGLTGVLLVAMVLGELLAHPNVNYVVTVPGKHGPDIAFLAELVISFVLMLVILFTTNSRTFSRFTGLFAGCLVAAYITVEAPISRMSLNPARTFASALPACLWNSLWVYFTAPPLGMLLAAEFYLRLRGKKRVLCAKLHHDHRMRCIFRCGYKTGNTCD